MRYCPNCCPIKIRIKELTKEGVSGYGIHRVLEYEGHKVSESTVHRYLRKIKTGGLAGENPPIHVSGRS